MESAGNKLHRRLLEFVLKIDRTLVMVVDTVVLNAGKCSLVNLIVIVAILPDRPQLVDISVVAEKEGVGGAREGSDVSAKEVMRIGVGETLNSRAKAGVGTIAWVLKYGN